MWGNIRHGCDVIADSREERTIRAWAWDLETNVKVTSDVTFKKLVQRKRNNQTQWVEPDERDLRELTNKHAAISKRNCLLELLPSDMVEDACNQARATLTNQAATDPDAARKQIVIAFGGINVPIIGLETYLGHAIAECSPDELTNLRAIYKSIKDGNSTWAEYVKPAESNDEIAAQTRAKMSAIKAKQAAATDETPAIEGEPVIEDLDAVTENLRAEIEAEFATLSKDQIEQITGGKALSAMTQSELEAVKDALEGMA